MKDGLLNIYWKKTEATGNEGLCIEFETRTHVDINMRGIYKAGGFIEKGLQSINLTKEDTVELFETLAKLQDMISQRQ